MNTNLAVRLHELFFPNRKAARGFTSVACAATDQGHKPNANPKFLSDLDKSIIAFADSKNIVIAKLSGSTLPSSLNFVFRVFFRSAWPKMVRVHAPRLVARVKNIHSFWNRADTYSVGKSMRPNRLSIVAESSVSISECPSAPDPASAMANLLNLAPKPFFGIPFRAFPALMLARARAVSRPNSYLGARKHVPFSAEFAILVNHRTL